MTREQAIEQIVGVWSQASQDRCVGMDELDADRRDMREALKTLGVTDDEIDLH